MDKKFNPQEIESKWYNFWEKHNLFAPSAQGEPFCIAIPPPNVTGTLHMGHAFQSTIIDTLIRYHRMNGKNVLWQMGTDHAGIATQMLVERQLASRGKNKHQLGREKFIKEIWKWKEQSGNTIANQLRRLGASVDWQTSRFTMDEAFCSAVTEAFVRLYEQGLIYRSKKLINWDPILQTAVSDLEVTTQEEEGVLYHVRYPFVEETGYMTIATTRPETILADGALAIHPESQEYQQHLGKMVHVPRTDRIIPVIADAYVKSEFGSGCVKITPAHDFNDYEVGKRHKMVVINLFTPTATMNENAPAKYQGMDRYEARAAIVKDLEADGLLVKKEKRIYSPPRGDRSGVILEPYMTDQWFVKMKELANRAIKVVKEGQTEFVPKRWEKTYFAWLDIIQDWCISRQLWWGHRIPAWYDDNNNILVGRNEREVREKNNLATSVPLKQDEDVLDTWFSSSLWTFATLGWPAKSHRQAVFNPTNVLVTGFDIIFFWVARMIMMTLAMKDEIPFHQVYIHGLVRDAEGQKMSKSKGNILDPLDLIDGIKLDDLLTKRTSNLLQPEKAPLIEKATRRHFPKGISAHGTDALRFTFCALASTAHDLNFDTSRCLGYRNFCNKLWNAARYVSMQQEEKTTAEKLSLVDKWAQACFAKASYQITQALNKYRFDIAAQSLYEFVWNEFCDWYIEFSKPLLNGDDRQVAAVVATNLRDLLDKTLRLAHPFIPFITEEIWQQMGFASPKNLSIMTAPYPLVTEEPDMSAFAEIDWLRELISAARSIRSELQLPPKQPINLLLLSDNHKEYQLLKDYSNLIQSLGALIETHKTDYPKPAGKSIMVGSSQVFFPIDKTKEKEIEKSKLEKKLNQLNTIQEKLSQKLANKDFITRAPEEIVASNQEKLKRNQQECNLIKEQLRLLN